MTVDDKLKFFYHLLSVIEITSNFHLLCLSFCGNFGQILKLFTKFTGLIT